MKLKKGDKVKIITGKDKGKTGMIIKVLPKKDKVIIEGLNMVKKHLKPNDKNEQGGIFDIEAMIQMSNVKLVKEQANKKTKKPLKVAKDKKSK